MITKLTTYNHLRTRIPRWMNNIKDEYSQTNEMNRSVNGQQSARNNSYWVFTLHFLQFLFPRFCKQAKIKFYWEHFLFTCTICKHWKNCLLVKKLEITTFLSLESPRSLFFSLLYCQIKLTGYGIELSL